MKYIADLVCPVSKGKLIYNESNNELISNELKLAYPIIDGIPVMLRSAAKGKVSDLDELYLNHNEMYSDRVDRDIDFYNKFYSDSKDYKRYNKADVFFVKRLIKRLGINQNSKVLDIGAGTGYFGKIFKDVADINLYNSDFSIEGFRTAKKIYNLDCVFVMDAYSPCFRNEMFDVVIAVGLTPLHRIDSKHNTELTKTINKLLKPGGYFVLVQSTDLSGKHTTVYSERKKVSDSMGEDIIAKRDNYANYDRPFVNSFMSETNDFSEIKIFSFIRPFAQYFRFLAFSKLNTFITETILKILPTSPQFSARLMAIGKKRI